MRRTTTPAPRGVLEVDWPFFGELCRALALRVAREYQPEVVLGVAKAGVIPASIRGRRVLVVDETCDTGSTIKLALSEVRALRPLEVRTAVSFKTGDYSPDFFAFATEKLIILPWDREIIQGGELVMRPDYAAWLGS